MLLDEKPLFDPSLLQELDWSSNTVSFSPPISPSQPGEGLLLRPLCTADFNRGKLTRMLLVEGPYLGRYTPCLERSPERYLVERNLLHICTSTPLFPLAYSSTLADQGFYKDFYYHHSVIIT